MQASRSEAACIRSNTEVSLTDAATSTQAHQQTVDSEAELLAAHEANPGGADQGRAVLAQGKNESLAARGRDSPTEAGNRSRRRHTIPVTRRLRWSSTPISWCW